MDIIRVTGCPPYDGDYEIDFKRFTNRELRTIKKVSGGIVAAKLEEALNDGDQDAFLGVTYVAIERSGKFGFVSEELLLDAAADAFEFIEDAEQEDEDAASADPNSPTRSEPDSDSNPSIAPESESETSGLDSRNESDPPPPTPLRTGTQG